MKIVRGFLARPAAIAAAAVMLALVAVACSQQSSSPVSPSASRGGTLAVQDDGLKGVICHATGSASNPFTGVVVGLQTTDTTVIFSNNGHLDANGSTLSGHEDDFYLGPSPPNTKQDCPGGPTPTPTPTPTPGV